METHIPLMQIIHYNDEIGNSTNGTFELSLYGETNELRSVSSVTGFKHNNALRGEQGSHLRNFEYGLYPDQYMPDGASGTPTINLIP